jgi:hypothetical protein
MLLTVTNTLRGHPWPERDTFRGADVAAAVCIKVLSRCGKPSISEVEALALGISSRGFRWADVDGDQQLDIQELLQV